jgi:hypothetical protein
MPAPALDERIALLRNSTHEFAKLLAVSGWTQQELADRLDKGQKWVDRQMRFGRFLTLSPIGLKLTEGAFRSFWEQTDKDADEAARFAEVARLIEEQGPKAKPSRDLGGAVMAKLADGKWHPLDGIAEKLGATQEDSRATLEVMRTRGAYHSKVETKKVGLRPHYRIFKQDRMVSVQELTEKLGPMVKDLIAEGKKNMATMSPPTVAHLAALIKQQLDQWSA